MRPEPGDDSEVESELSVASSTKSVTVQDADDIVKKVMKKVGALQREEHYATIKDAIVMQQFFTHFAVFEADGGITEDSFVTLLKSVPTTGLQQIVASSISSKNLPWVLHGLAKTYFYADTIKALEDNKVMLTTASGVLGDMAHAMFQKRYGDRRNKLEGFKSDIFKELEQRSRLQGAAAPAAGTGLFGRLFAV